MLLTLARDPVQLDLAADQQKEPIGGIALVHERGVIGQAPETGQGADILEGFFRQPAEQVMPAQG